MTSSEGDDRRGLNGRGITMRATLTWSLVVALAVVQAACNGGSTSSHSADPNDPNVSARGEADAYRIADGAANPPETERSPEPDTGPPPVYKFNNCTAAADCAATACAPAFEPECVATCLNETDVAPDVLPLAQNLATCIRKSCVEMDCKDNPQKDCMEKCMDDFCLGDTLLCVDEGGFGDGQCLMLGPCMGKCKLTGSDPFKCMGKCYNSLSTEAKAQADVLGQCVLDKGIISKCCINTVKCGTNNKTGTKPCGHYMKNCTECATQWTPPAGQTQVGPECFFFCMAEVNAEGQQIFAEQNEQGCHDLHEEHGDHAHPPSEVCAQLFYKCLLHEVDGPMPCSGFDGCVQDCYSSGKGGSSRDFGGSGDACSMECSSKLKASSHKIWIDRSRCSWDCQAYCGDDRDPQACTTSCIHKTCTSQTAACQADK